MPIGYHVVVLLPYSKVLLIGYW